MKGGSIVQSLINTYKDDIWNVYYDDPSIEGPYYVGFKAGDTYMMEKDGTVQIIYRYPYTYDSYFEDVYGLGVIKKPNVEVEKDRILSTLSYLIPKHAKNIYNTFIEISLKNYQKNEHYMRKEYFGNRPVSMDIGGGSIIIYICPEGSKEKSNSWDTKKGEVREDYYYAK